MRSAIFKKINCCVAATFILFTGASGIATTGAKSNAWTCQATHVERMGAETPPQKQLVCISRNKNQIQSKTCLDGKCLRHLPSGAVSMEGIWGPNGNPGFHLCHHLGYAAEMIRFRESGTLREFGRCVFTSTDFVDTDLLFKMVRDRAATAARDKPPSPTP